MDKYVGFFYKHLVVNKITETFYVHYNGLLCVKGSAIP